MVILLSGISSAGLTWSPGVGRLFFVRQNLVLMPQISHRQITPNSNPNTAIPIMPAQQIRMLSHKLIIFKEEFKWGQKICFTFKTNINRIKIKEIEE